MVEENKTEEVEPKEPKEPQQPVQEKEEPVGLSLEDLEKHKADIRKELEEGRNLDKSEREALKQQLSEIQDFIKKLEKAQKEREETKGDHTTIVVPPSQLSVPPPQQQSQSVNPENIEGTTKKRGGWRRIW